jgi:hypothetical protein
LDGIKKNKTTENCSPFGDHPGKNDEENDCEMAAKVGEPRQDLIQNG